VPAASAPADPPDRGEAAYSASPRVGDFPAAAWGSSTVAGVSSTLGAPPDFELGFPVEEEPLRELEEMLLRLNLRRDTARNATTFTSAVPGAEPEEYFRVTDLRRHLPELEPNAERRLSRVLDGGACDTAAIRRELIAGAAPGAAAAVLEFGEIEPGSDRGGFDITAVSLVGSDYAVPVGFNRSDFPSADSPDVRLLEQYAATNLLEQLADELGAVVADPVPLISFDQRFAENHQLRHYIQELGYEFVLPVREDFDEATRPRRVGEPQRHRLLMSERMPFELDGTPPAPEIYSLEAPPSQREYLFGLPGTPGEYAIVYPGDLPGALTGRRGFDRGAELVALARSVRPPRIIERLRLLRFLHLNPRGWDTAAHLLSAYWAACLGRLPPPER
jgi:hypothetical protein